MTSRLKIEQWAFWSPESRAPAEWLEHWSRREARSGTAELGADAIPAVQRRRMSALSKMAVQVAIEAGRDRPADYLIFCSQHGEIARTSALLDSIVAGDALSPAAFSQSVHNTSAGLFSIITRNRAPATSIASGPSTFAYGWLEAEGFLAENRGARALLVSFDAALPPEYEAFASQIQCTYAAAMVLCAADDGGLALQCADSSERDAPLPFAPSFLAWWLSAAPSLSLSGDGFQWVWTRN
jgi:hypothetical protein